MKCGAIYYYRSLVALKLPTKNEYKERAAEIIVDDDEDW